MVKLEWIICSKIVYGNKGDNKWQIKIIQILDAACELWGHIPAEEYRKVIVGLIFLRYISSAFKKKYQALVDEGDGFEDDRDAYVEDNIFFVPVEARWS